MGEESQVKVNLRAAWPESAHQAEAGAFPGLLSFAILLLTQEPPAPLSVFPRCYHSAHRHILRRSSPGEVSIEMGGWGS